MNKQRVFHVVFYTKTITGEGLGEGDYCVGKEGMTIEQLIVIYLIAINVIAFFMYGIDKWKAKRSKWRIPEATLLGMAVIGGSIGALLGMKVWHHKTQHKKFRFGVPTIIIIQLILICYFTLYQK